MASKPPNNSRDIGFYLKKTDSANNVNNQPDATPNSSDDVTHESHVTKNCSDRVAKQLLPLPNANAALSTSSPSATFQDEQSSVVSNAAYTNQHGKSSVLSFSTEDVIKMIEDQFPYAVVHNYYLCNSKYCTGISANEATRLKGERKKFLHTWIQDKENV